MMTTQTNQTTRNIGEPQLIDFTWKDGTISPRLMCPVMDEEGTSWTAWIPAEDAPECESCKRHSDDFILVADRAERCDVAICADCADEMEDEPEPLPYL